MLNSNKTTSKGVKLSVGIADMVVVKGCNQEIITHALGSCVGVTIFDPIAGVGGLLHYMLDRPRTEARASEHPVAMYATLGVPELFREAYKLGATKERMIVCAAGAAEMLGHGSALKIGKRNQVMLRKLLWKNDITLVAEDTGGSDARTMSLSMRSGAVDIHCRNSRSTLWTP